MPVTRAEPGKTRVGWIGTGVMGQSMCRHLMSKGYPATVYNRSRDKAKALLDA
ncbi:MAG TPA: NAD(P)-binding domain-containing protein, partial [Gemmataceae bacterium]|nr:NAD(P)-binding domain-containing protein [Gemmataceae bacterium]